MQLPEHYSLVYSASQIAEACRRLGGEVSKWLESFPSSEHLVTIPVLRGGLFFYADLVRAIPKSVELYPARTAGYDVETNSAATAGVSLAADDIPVQGRVVLIVDDICDSGKTLKALEERLRARGAREVRSAALILRRVDIPCAMTPAFVGFEYHGPEWLVGYGMDDRDRWRNLPAVYRMSPQG